MTTKILTPEGFQKMKDELKYLTEEKLPDIIDKIEKAKELGDLSENAEYHDAKDNQGMTAARIKEIELIFKDVIISDPAGSSDEITMSSTFTVENEAGEKKEFSIVGYNEAEPAAGKISNESPMGEAFMGGKPGDVVEVDVPRGLVKFKIIEIK